MTDHNKPARLASLDILRGFDLFLLVFLQPVIISIARVYHPEWAEPLLYQLDHEMWEGFRCWDLVMPLFLFMTGAAMPFALSRFMDGREPKSAAYRKVFRRFVILFVLGMVVQGNLLGFDFGHIYFYVNTLQAIGTGYLISALIMLNTGLKGQLWSTVGLLAVYSLPMIIEGDYSPEGNFANRLDHVIMGRFRGDPSYTWIWSSLTFAVTVMLGSFAGQTIRRGMADKKRTALVLAGTGVALVAAGWLWSFGTPVIKRIWTGSMTLLSGGYCFLLMALFYWWIDVLGHSRGLGWLKIYGMNSITAYILGETISFRSVASSLSYGLKPYLGDDWYGVWLTLANFLIVFLILAFMYRRRIFLKI